VVEVGETVLLAPLPKLLLQLYCVPPLAVSVWLAPLQMLAEAGVILAVGLAFTVTCLLAVAVQLDALVTVTVYVVVVVGEKVAVALLPPPLLHA
jgi:hypothetical protein